jgi:hypothetical protein
MEFVYLIIAFIIIVSIATYILWKKIPPTPDEYRKLLEEQSVLIRGFEEAADISKKIERIQSNEMVKLGEIISELRKGIQEANRKLEADRVKYPKEYGGLNNKIIIQDERGEEL